MSSVNDFMNRVKSDKAFAQKFNSLSDSEAMEFAKAEGFDFSDSFSENGKLSDLQLEGITGGSWDDFVNYLKRFANQFYSGLFPEVE